MPRCTLVLMTCLSIGAPAGVSAQDVAADPTYGDIELDAGFMPDPKTASVTSGGKIEVDVGGCAYGYVANAPDVDLYYTTSGGSDLFIYVDGEGDTTLLINAPDGSWLCDDDGFGDGDPIVRIPDADDGLYDIWVGSYSNDSHDAILHISEIDPGSSTSSSVPDYTLEPAFGTATLEEGFMPDPHTEDVVAGGSIDLSLAECSYGFVAEAPDFDLYYTTDGGTDLYIYAESKDDVTLLVNTPSGGWVCDDDGYEGTNPLLAFDDAEDGLYNIWVGSYDGERTAATKLRFTEIDPG